tara:strand:- start:106 stop:915 length:810 start_codon:yes stop_codon:yes gene_type:complete
LLSFPLFNADAYHRGDERITDDTAFTLRDGELRLGIWKVEYGLFESVDLHTYTIPFLVGAGNAGIKWQYIWDEKSSISLRAHSLKLDLANFESDEDSEDSEDSEAAFWILPFELTYSRDLEDDMTLSLGWLYNRVIVSGASSGGDAVNGAAAITTGQLTATLQLNHSETFASIIHARALSYQDLSAQGSIVRTETIPPDITLEIAGSADTSSDAAEVDGGFSIIASGQHSWSSFNLRYGIGYGNWSLPVINMVMPEKSGIVEFDMFWRF